MHDNLHSKVKHGAGSKEVLPQSTAAAVYRLYGSRMEYFQRQMKQYRYHVFVLQWLCLHFTATATTNS